MFFFGGLVLNTLTLKLETGGIVNGKGQQRRGGMLGGKSSCQILCFRSLDTVPPIELVQFCYKFRGLYARVYIVRT